jgi:hypothetical protein
MAIVYRNGRPRLQRSVRRNGRVTTVYRGSGEFAVLVAGLEETERRMADAAREREGADIAQLEELDRTLERLAQDARAAARDALERAGFHQHQRGEWRRPRAQPD